MTVLSKKIRHKAEQYHEWIFPREIEMPDFLLQVLDMVYEGKGIEWKLVKFYYGLPWFMHYATNEASTQPGTYDNHSIHVYYRKSMWSPYSIRGLSTIVHECFHVMQFRQVLDGWGIGFFRFWYCAPGDSDQTFPRQCRNLICEIYQLPYIRLVKNALVRQ